MSAQRNVRKSKQVKKEKQQRDDLEQDKQREEILRKIFKVQTKLLKHEGRTKDHLLAFARKDYELVHQEILDIKSCRTNLFMGTLGVLGMLGIAVLGILGAISSASVVGIGNQNILRIIKSSSWKIWLPCAALMPVGLLVCSILATIHKAIGLNMRPGY